MARTKAEVALAEELLQPNNLAIAEAIIDTFYTKAIDAKDRESISRLVKLQELVGKAKGTKN